MHNYKELNVWKRSIKLCATIYKLTSNFPNEERFGLISQMRRASVSVPSNIAEGFGRGSRNEFVNFLSITNGSLNEVKSQLYRALDKEYINQDEFDRLYEIADHASNKTGSLIGYLNSSMISGQKFKDRTNVKRETSNVKQ